MRTATLTSIYIRPRNIEGFFSGEILQTAYSKRVRVRVRVINTIFARFGVYFQIQSETETIDFPVEFDMAAVRGVMHAPRW